jgi:hypothetical protein
MLTYFSVITSNIDEKLESKIQNTLETNYTNKAKVVEHPSDTFDSFFKEFEVEERETNKCNSATIQSTIQPSVQSQNTKQSLFIRLANRIKVILTLRIVEN